MRLNKVEKGETGGYMCIHTAFLSDSNLSLDAIGLLTWMLNKPDSWDFTIAGTAKALGISKGKASKLYNTLIEKGYMVREMIHFNGKISDWAYKVSDISLIYGEVNQYPKKQDIDLQDAQSIISKKFDDESILRNEAMEAAKEQIGFESLCETHDKTLLDRVVACMADCFTAKSETISLSAKVAKATSDVVERFKQLTAEKVSAMLTRIKEFGTTVSSTKSYLLTALYRASEDEPKKTPKKTPKKKPKKTMISAAELDDARRNVAHQINADELKADFEHGRHYDTACAMIDSIIDQMAYIAVTPEIYLQVNGANMDICEVRDKLNKLTGEGISDAVSRVLKLGKKVRNPQKFWTTTLYNAATTAREEWVQHNDFYADAACAATFGSRTVAHGTKVDDTPYAPEPEYPQPHPAAPAKKPALSDDVKAWLNRCKELTEDAKDPFGTVSDADKKAAVLKRLFEGT